MAAPPLPMYCGDRINHPGLGAGRCQNITDGAYGQQSPCLKQGDDPHIHAAGLTVCGMCANDTQRLPWTVAQVARADEQSPDWMWDKHSHPVPDLGPGRPPWPGFLTLLCQHCEKRELELLLARTTGQPAAWTALPPAIRHQPPLNNCVCRGVLEARNPGQRLCLPHRRRIWNQLIQKKDANDLWLRTLDVKFQAGEWLSCTARADTLRKRTERYDYYYRACRCGANADGYGDVLLCMACEGTVYRTDPRTQNTTYRRLRRARRIRDERPIALGRPRSRKTKGFAMSVND